MWRGLRFGLVGVSGVTVNSVCLWLLTEQAHLYYLLSSILATEVAIISNFTLHHLWTFSSLDGAGSLPVRLAKYNILALGGLLLTVLTLFVLTKTWGLHYLVANLLAIGAGTIWNYLSSRRWIWIKVRPADTTEGLRQPVGP